jgi:hypothetical protein
MEKKDYKIIKDAFIQSSCLLIYVAIVATILNNGEKIFPQMPSVIGAIIFLMLFVFSAAISFSLVFGRSILAYLDGRKKEGVMLFIYTIVWVFVFIILLGFLVAIFR